MDNKRVIIIGGVAGGASAAARARRLSESAEIILVERGPDVSFANCGLPYHIGGTIPSRQSLLVQTPEGLRKRYKLDVRVRTEAVRIDRAAKTVILRDLATGKESAEAYDALILSPGAEPVRPPIPGADRGPQTQYAAFGDPGPLVFTLRNLGDMDAIKQAVDARKGRGARRAVVIGGGYIGLEMAENLRHVGLDVTLVELANQVFLAVDAEMAAPVHQQLKLHGVDLRLGTSVAGIEPSGDGLRVRLSTGETLEAALAILAVGVRPEVKLAREAALAIGPTGGIVVDEHMRTSDPAIYAVGDAVEVTDLVGGRPSLIPLAGPANRQGRIAADNVFGRPSVYRRTQGTAICKVFDLAVGLTGLTEKAARKAGRACEKVYIHPASHAGYYPGAAAISLKLLFDPGDGRVLGAQAVGADGVDKRIDVLATAIRAGMTVFDLADLELSYAPPYGSARDPVNYAGFVASNVIKGDMPVVHAEEAVNPRPNQLLLDVRTPAEVEAGTIPGAINIPVDQLRARLGELPRDKEILAFCQVGLRGYVAVRILNQSGFTARNLSGGYKTYQAVVGTAPKAPATAEGPRDHAPSTGAGNNSEAMPPGPVATAPEAPVRRLDCRGMQCPGPIMRLRAELEPLSPGQALEIAVADPGFPADVAAWCQKTGHQLREIAPADGHVRAVVVKQAPAAATAATPRDGKTLVVFSGDFDKAMAAFIIANGAAAMGSPVTMFFTFWGINVLRRPEPVSAPKNLVERMFGWMMPRGAGKLGLSRMNMGGAGLAMLKGIMRKKNVPSLPELIASARAAGARLVACSMSMGLMGIRREELIDGVEAGGVATFLAEAGQSDVTLFI